MDTKIVKECSSCKHYEDGQFSIDSAPPFCWDCAPSPQKLRWEPHADLPWKTQVDGKHYTDCAIQPFEYSMANKLDPMQHTIIKYVTRFRAKGGERDLRAAIHTIELLIDWESKHGTKTGS